VVGLFKGVSHVFTVFVLICATACGGGDDDGFEPEGGAEPDPNIPPVTSGQWYRPSLATTWQWQLQENVNTEYDVALYELDLFEAPASVIEALQASGRRVLCYFSAGSCLVCREADRKPLRLNREHPNASPEPVSTFTSRVRTRIEILG